MVEVAQIREHTNRLDVHISTRPDRLHPQVLRDLAHVIVRPLSSIFERLLQLGEVPEDWEKANAIPIFKKGPKEDPENYRLIILTSVPEKVTGSK